MQEILDDQIVSMATICQNFPSESRSGHAASAWISHISSHDPEIIVSHGEATWKIERGDIARTATQLFDIFARAFTLYEGLACSTNDQFPQELETPMEALVVVLNK